jgi:hypothetical protein
VLVAAIVSFSVIELLIGLQYSAEPPYEAIVRAPRRIRFEIISLLVGTDTRFSLYAVLLLVYLTRLNCRQIRYFPPESKRTSHTRPYHKFNSYLSNTLSLCKDG